MSFAATVAMGSTALAAPLAPPPVVIPPPIAISPTAAPAGEWHLVTWHPGSIACAGEADPQAIDVRRPFNGLRRGAGRLEPVTLRFDIDARGRAVSIVRQAPQGGSDVQAGPALAASRFAAGQRRSGCTVTYAPRAVSLTAAPREDLASYVLTRQRPPLPRIGRERLMESDGCAAASGMQPLRMAFPDYSRLTETPGVLNWTVVVFDVDAQGAPQGPRTLSSTGDRALDAAAIEAIAASRFSPGTAQTGCTAPFHLRAGTLPAPPPPESENDAGGCKRDGWAIAPQLDYPRPYHIRSIEGWALLHYDVAPWGEIGSIAVVEAQPSEDFGTAAKLMLSRARAHPGTGATGCKVRVLYKTSDSEGKDLDAPPE
jgi:TonB family protein